MNRKKLFRSKKDRMIFGVCGGLGEYLNVDAIILRVIFLLLLLWGGLGALVYLIFAIMTPEEKNKDAEGEQGEGEDAILEKNVASIVKVVRKITKRKVDNRGILIGLSLTFILFLRLAGEVFGFFNASMFWLTQLALVVIAFYLLFIYKEK